MHARLIAVAAAAVFAVSGCANMTETQKDTATGAAIGTAAGAAIGAIAGGGKGAAIGAGIGAAAGAGGGSGRSACRSRNARWRKQPGARVSVTQTPNNELKLNIPSDISFDTGKSQIKPQMRPVLDQFAYGLKGNPAATVRIIGYTDSTGTDAINNPLSVNRAASTRDYLTAHGVNPNRIAIDGRGSSDPIADNSTAEGRARNRRVEVLVAEPSAAPPSAPQQSFR